MAPSYPTPVRTVKHGYHTDESGGMIQELASATGELSDTRPYVAEVWSEGGVKYVMFFFSSQDIDVQSRDAMLALLTPNSISYTCRTRTATTSTQTQSRTTPGSRCCP